VENRILLTDGRAAERASCAVLETVVVASSWQRRPRATDVIVAVTTLSWRCVINWRRLSVRPSAVSASVWLARHDQPDQTNKHAASLQSAPLWADVGRPSSVSITMWLHCYLLSPLLFLATVLLLTIHGRTRANCTSFIYAYNLSRMSACRPIQHSRRFHHDVTAAMWYSPLIC